MSRVPDILAEASGWVTPSGAEEERLRKLSGRLLANTLRAAGRFPETRGVLMGGSYAKGTWLPAEVDLDIFVRIDATVPDERFERVGLAVGRAATRGLPAGKKYAQHPYTEAVADGVKVNVVPCYDVAAGMWKSAADRSPYHVDLVKALSEERKTQVRLLKRFMKSVGVYGAEIQTQGFSGYVAEVLVIRLGNLGDVLRWFSALKFRDEGNPLALADPVDEGRDLGVAVSKEKLGRMVMASREFLRHPNASFFHMVKGRARPPMRPSVFAVVFSHRKLSEDILWGELRRTARHIVSHVDSRGFRIARWMAASNGADRSAILLISEFSDLPKLEQHVGPTVDREKDVRAFLSANRSSASLVWVDDDAKLRTLRPRTYLTLSGVLREISRGKAGQLGASKEMGDGLRRNALVLQGERLAKAAKASAWLEAGLREITTDAIGTRDS